MSAQIICGCAAKASCKRAAVRSALLTPMSAASGAATIETVAVTLSVSGGVWSWRLGTAKLTLKDVESCHNSGPPGCELYPPQEHFSKLLGLNRNREAASKYIIKTEPNRTGNRCMLSEHGDAILTDCRMKSNQTEAQQSKITPIKNDS